MESAKEAPRLDTPMANEDSVVPEKMDESKPTYKSFKKKYRKMRLNFDEVMRQSNEMFVKERKAQETAQRLAREIDGILELLLDANACAQIPAEKRIDLSTATPSLSAVPSLISADELSRASELTTPEGQAIYNEVRGMLDEKAAAQSVLKPSKSLAQLMASTPHLSLNSSHVAPELLTSLEPTKDQKAPPQYITASDIEEHLYEIDARLGLVPPISSPQPPFTERDLALQNPVSVYNWLRQHEPKIFLQDGEGSEKSNGKPGALRGAGKRGKQDQPVEAIEEDNTTLETFPPAPPSTKGKRKRTEDDDGGYHPKLGQPKDGTGKKARISKKKRSDGSGEQTTPSTAKKGRGKNKLPSPDPNAHPFGPI